MFVVIQAVNLNTLEVTARYNTKDRIAIDHRQVPEAVVVHLTKRVNGYNRWRYGYRVTRHELSNRSLRRVSALGKSANGIPACEDTKKSLLMINHEYRSFTAFPHTPTGFLD